MSEPKRTYQTPADGLLGTESVGEVLWSGTVMRHGVAHPIDVIREDGDEVLASGPTFFGWVRRAEVILSE